MDEIESKQDGLDGMRGIVFAVGFMLVFWAVVLTAVYLKTRSAEKYHDADILAMWIFGTIVVLVVILFSCMAVRDLVEDRRRMRMRMRRRLAERARQSIC